MTTLEEAKAKALEDFRAAGLLIDDPIADGEIHRCPVLGGKPGTMDGAYKIHPDDPISWWFKNHKTGEIGKGSLKAAKDKRLTKEGRDAFKRQQEANRKARAKKKEDKHAATAERARRIYEKATDCSDHAYLTAKKTTPCSGLKLSASPFEISGISFPAGSLIVPIYDPAALFPGSGKNPGGASDEPVNLQFINETGDKRYLPGGKKQGCAFVIGGGADWIILALVIICEGLATGLTLREATGFPVFVAFDVGNLLAVAEVIRRKYPERSILLAADDDWRTEGNPGLSKATAAARAVGGCLAVPAFGPERGPKDTDFNDMAARYGLGAVRECIDEAIKKGPLPDEGTAQPKKESHVHDDDRSQVGAFLQGEKPAQPIDEGYLVSLQTDPAAGRDMTGEEIITGLAELPGLEYAKRRKDEAKKLGINVGNLDRLVKGERRNATSTPGIVFDEIEAWKEAVNGASLLDDLTATIQRFIICSPHVARATALWIVMTWLMDTVLTAPLALITAPEMRCGKSQLLTLIGNLSFRPLASSSISPAALFRVIQEYSPTLTLDEADATLKDNEELRSCLQNYGYRLSKR